MAVVNSIRALSVGSHSRMPYGDGQRLETSSVGSGIVFNFPVDLPLRGMSTLHGNTAESGGHILDPSNGKNRNNALDFFVNSLDFCTNQFLESV